MEEKLDRIIFLLEDCNVGICPRVRLLEQAINGNGKPGIAEKVRGLQASNAKVAALISSGIGLLSIPLWEIFKHYKGW